MKKLNAKKIIGIILAGFLVWNLAWFLVWSVKYSQYTEEIPKNKWDAHFIKKDGYIYSVKKPDYLSFTGNLAVSNHEEGESLIIWPKVTGGYLYGVRLQKDGKAYEIYVDKELTPIKKDEGDQTATQIVEKYHRDIQSLFSKAEKMWDLG